MTKRTEVAPIKLTTISGILASEPHFEKRKRKHKPFMVLELLDDRRKFKTQSFSYSVFRVKEFKKNVAVGDSISIRVKSKQFLSPVEELNRMITEYTDIYELWTPEESYISLEDRNEYRKKDLELGYIAWLIGLAFYIFKFVLLAPDSTKENKQT